MNPVVFNRQERGHRAETYACALLRRLGMTLVARNYRYLGGEIDIVAQTPAKVWVFVEVKSVWHPKMGNPNRRVGYTKQYRLWRTAVHFLHFHGGQEQKARFDVICLDYRQGQPRLQHYPNAFEASQSLPYC